jgi:hypothetical protein
MSRNIKLLFAILFQFTLSFAQVQLPANTERYPDSLNAILSSTGTDYVKANICPLLNHDTLLTLMRPRECV